MAPMIAGNPVFWLRDNALPPPRKIWDIEGESRTVNIRPVHRGRGMHEGTSPPNRKCACQPAWISDGGQLLRIANCGICRGGPPWLAMQHPKVDSEPRGSPPRPVARSNHLARCEGPSARCRGGRSPIAYEGLRNRGRGKFSADEKKYSVVRLREEKKFPRRVIFGTPSFSLTASLTEDLSTINTFS